MVLTPVTPVTGRPIRVAIVGAGSMGMNHVRVVRDFAEDAVELVGVAEPHAPTLARAVSRFHVTGSPDYRQLLDQTRPDVVAVVVPTHLHSEVAAYALDAGLHVLVDKPIATTAEEALALIDLARVRGVHLVVGHVERSNPAILELKRRLDGGELGRLYSLQARRLGPFPPRIRDVSVILDLATHDLDAMRYLTGSEVVHLFAEAQRRLHGRHEDLLLGVIRFASDALGLLDVNWLTPTKVRELSVTGERGMFLVNYLTQDLYFYENDYSATTWEALRTTAGVSEGTMTRLKVQKAEPLRLEYENLLAAVRGEAAPRVTGEDGLVVLRLAHRLVQAAQTREVVECGVPATPAR